MLYKKNQSESLDTELFRNPTSEYRAAPFWAWNCKLDRDRILRQIDYFKEMGFGGFHMHSRTGMASRYLDEEFMGHIKACVEKAKSEGMLAWLYDEDRWASGAAGGYVTKDKKFRIKHLHLSTARPAAFLDKKTAFDEGKPYFLAAYDVILDEKGRLTAYRRIGADEEAQGTKWYACVCVADDNPWFNNQSYPDTMDRETVQRFIDITYNAYQRAVGEEFDQTVPAIFTDEPNILCRDGGFPNAASDESGISFSWSRFFEEKYQERYGEDILDRLPEIVWLTADRSDSAVKYRYFDFCAEQFAESYADQCGEWCKNHGVALTGHILREPTLEEQVFATGDNMRNYRSFGIPGIDMLCNRVELTTAKQCQSVVHQMEKEAMLSELYGVTNWDFDFKGHKFQGDWQAALGVTVRVHHLSWMSMGGEAKRDYPASIFYQSPWYKEYPYIEDHFARLNTVLTRGKPVVRVGVIHPVESYWISMGPNDQTGEARQALDNNFLTVTRWLLEGHQDFNFINESLLPSQAKAELPRQVGAMEYDAIVIPDCLTLRQTTVDYLEKFAKAGGKVLFMGGCPTYLDGVRSDGAQSLFEKSVRISFNKTALMDALEDYRRVDIRKKNGLPADRMLYQLRQDGEEQWLFIAPFKQKKGLSARKERTQDGTIRGERLNITVDGEWEPRIYDTLTGKVLPVTFRHQGGKTVVQYEFFESDSLLLRFSAPHYHELILQEDERLILRRTDFKDMVSFEREEENVLLLDMAEWRLDEEDWQPREEILLLDNAVRKRLGFPLRTEKFAQPWVVPEEKPEHTLSLRYEVYSDIRLKEVKLALEAVENTELLWNGKPISNAPVGQYVDEDIKTVALLGLKKGVNRLELRFPFVRRTNPEACFILGDFNVEVRGCKTRITAPEKNLAFGSVAKQGLPFYGGNITYVLPVEAPKDCDLEVHIGKYKGAHCTVSLDGGEAQAVSFMPSNARFRKVTKGAHTLRITLYGHRGNTFGAVHNCDEYTEWFGPDAWRSLGDRWSYEYQLKEIGLLISPQITFYR